MITKSSEQSKQSILVLGSFGSQNYTNDPPLSGNVSLSILMTAMPASVTALVSLKAVVLRSVWIDSRLGRMASLIMIVSRTLPLTRVVVKLIEPLRRGYLISQSWVNPGLVVRIFRVEVRSSWIIR